MKDSARNRTRDPRRLRETVGDFSQGADGEIAQGLSRQIIPSPAERFGVPNVALKSLAERFHQRRIQPTFADDDPSERRFIEMTDARSHACRGKSGQSRRAVRRRQVQNRIKLECRAVDFFFGGLRRR